jgi:L-seryl-tRNA(Ser) seleniumtransferase
MLLQHDVIVNLLRAAVSEFRQSVAKGDFATTIDSETQVQDWIIKRFIAKQNALLGRSLTKTINATGVVLHTNLGRAPLSLRAREQVAAVMEGYSTLEYDLLSAGRGERYSHVEKRLTELTGAEAALVVNNNAAAVMLALAGIARGREVIVSRGELVEIGGSFRIPDVIRQSGAILVEVGTTNKTHLQDYAAAITPETAAILKVHTSNFAMVGFTSQPDSLALCQLAKQQQLVAINDVGSGTLMSLAVQGAYEPTVQECINAGFDLVTFSGDKLLGSAQAGLIVGRKKHIERLKREPLLRAVRIDKLSLAALEGTLIDYSTGLADLLVPARTMLHMTPEQLLNQAEMLAAALSPLAERGWRIRVIPTRSLAGGGSLPGVELAGYGVEVIPVGKSAGMTAQNLREGSPPIVCLVREAAVVFDVRCLSAGDIPLVCSALLKIAGGKRA